MASSSGRASPIDMATSTPRRNGEESLRLRMDGTLSSIHSDDEREDNVKKVGDLTEDEFRSLLRTVLQEKNNRMHVSGRAQKIPVSAECKTAVHQVYKIIGNGEIEHAAPWSYETGFQSDQNQSSLRLLVAEVKKVKDLEEDMIKAACQTYWRSRRDQRARQSQNTDDQHKARNRRNNIIRTKLKARKNALPEMNWSATKCRKVSEILTKAYMSSEEEEDGIEEGRARRRGPVKRVVRKLPWGSARLSKYKKKLDDKHMEGCTSSQLRAMAEVNRNNTNLSLRQKPTDAPDWAICNDDEADVSSSIIP